MLQFVSVLISMGFLEFGSPDFYANNAQIHEVKVEFSAIAIGIESGQPIFSQGTKVWVSNPTAAKINLYINDDEKEMTESTMEISGLSSGTYTLMIVDAENTEENRTVGFTIQ